MKFEKCKACKFMKYPEFKRPCEECRENRTPITCMECKYQFDYMYERSFNCVGNSIFVRCDEFEWS